MDIQQLNKDIRNINNRIKVLTNTLNNKRSHDKPIVEEIIVLRNKLSILVKERYLYNLNNIR